jgi:hypothetical protein
MIGKTKLYMTYKKRNKIAHVHPKLNGLALLCSAYILVTSNPNRQQCNDKQTTKKPAAHFSTFGFARHTSRPFAKPKELKFSNRTD